MKKAIDLGVTIASLFLLAGCGSTSSSSSNQKEPASSSRVEASSSSTKEQKIPAEYKAAYNKAEIYANTMSMSKRKIYDQLTSTYGEKFDKKPALWAIRHLTDVNWNANALQKAKDYQDQQSMSSSAIYTQLTSSYGERFTPAQAKYAINHLNK